MHTKKISVSLFILLAIAMVGVGSVAAKPASPTKVPQKSAFLSPKGKEVKLGFSEIVYAKKQKQGCFLNSCTFSYFLLTHSHPVLPAIKPVIVQRSNQYGILTTFAAGGRQQGPGDLLSAQDAKIFVKTFISRKQKQLLQSGVVNSNFFNNLNKTNADDLTFNTPKCSPVSGEEQLCKYQFSLKAYTNTSFTLNIPVCVTETHTPATEARCKEKFSTNVLGTSGSGKLKQSVVAIKSSTHRGLISRK